MNTVRFRVLDHSYIFAALVGLGLLLPGCDSISPQSEKSDENERIVQEIQDFRSTYSASLNHIGNHLDTTGASLGNKGAVQTGLQSFVNKRSGSNPEVSENAAEAFVNNYQNSKLRTRTFSESSAREDLPRNVREVVRSAQESLRNSTSYSAFKKHLRESRDSILAESWSKKEKKQALAYLVLVEETMSFVKSNPHLVEQSNASSVTADGQLVATAEEEEEETWWESWGKCVAGTVGGAGTGTLMGAAAGTTIPEPVTTGVGAAVGGVSGALGGAAASC